MHINTQTYNADRLQVGQRVMLMDGGRVGTIASFPDQNLALVRWDAEDYSRHLRSILIRVQ